MWLSYSKVSVKIEDKKECKRLKELLKDRYTAMLYAGDNKRLSWMKMVGSKMMLMLLYLPRLYWTISENILSNFVQTYIDTVSSVKQFLRRNRNRESNVLFKF